MPSPVREATGIATRFASFVLERFPFALAVVREVADACGVDRLTDQDVARIEAFRASFRRELRRMLDDVDVGDIAETTPGVAAPGVSRRPRVSCSTRDSFLAREAIRASFSTDERLESFAA